VPFLSKKLYADFEHELCFQSPIKNQNEILHFRVSNSSKSSTQQRFALAKINFFLANVTETPVKNIELLQANVKFLGIGDDRESRFEEYCSPVNLGKAIVKYREVSIAFCITDDYGTIEFNNLSGIWLRLEFNLTNIYDDRYKNTMEILTGLKKRGERFEGTPTPINMELTAL
jgi:hypothetical protein